MKKRILLILIMFILIICSTNIVQATTTGEIIGGADNFIATGQQTDRISGDALRTLSDTIYNVLLIVGTVIAVIIGAVLAIQFITGSVEQKAKIKDALVPFVIGCVIIFGAFGIWKLVVQIGASTQTPGTPQAPLTGGNGGGSGTSSGGNGGNSNNGNNGNNSNNSNNGNNGNNDNNSGTGGTSSGSKDYSKMTKDEIQRLYTNTIKNKIQKAIQKVRSKKQYNAYSGVQAAKKAVELGYITEDEKNLYIAAVNKRNNK